MNEPDTGALRERLTDLLAEWGAHMSCVLTELEQARQKLDAAEQASAQSEKRIAELDERVRAHENLISALRAEAESASELRLEVERKTAELDALKRDKERLEGESRELRQRVRELEEAADHESAGSSAEIESLRAELEARKSLIKSLRADSERARTLEASLEENRQLVQQLEDTVNRQASTIEELKRKIEAWRIKYRALKNGARDSTTTTTSLTDTGIPKLPQAVAQNENIVDQTIAIDMREALLEARRVAGIRDD